MMAPNLSLDTDAPSAGLRTRRGSPITLVRQASRTPSRGRAQQNQFLRV